ncbi:MAG: RsmE family RNA methyltransferase [Pirellulaceae bacterium]
MATARFLVPNLSETICPALDAAESRHAVNVLRLQAGDRVILFDGCGAEAVAEIIQINKRVVTLSVLERTDTVRELSSSLEVTVALPKGDRQKTLIEGLVQLGVDRLIPLQTTRGVAQPGSGTYERLERAIVEASKQCGRNRLMQLGQPLRVNELANLVKMDASERVPSYFAHPYAAAHQLHEVRHSKRCRIAIGPEGGFTEQECDLMLSAGMTSISFGPRILRVEVAALKFAAIWASLDQAAQG